MADEEISTSEVEASVPPVEASPLEDEEKAPLAEDVMTTLPEVSNEEDHEAKPPDETLPDASPAVAPAGDEEKIEEGEKKEKGKESKKDKKGKSKTKGKGKSQKGEGESGEGEGDEGEGGKSEGESEGDKDGEKPAKEKKGKKGKEKKSKPPPPEDENEAVEVEEKEAKESKKIKKGKGKDQEKEGDETATSKKSKKGKTSISKGGTEGEITDEAKGGDGDGVAKKEKKGKKEKAEKKEKKEKKEKTEGESTKGKKGKKGKHKTLPEPGSSRIHVTLSMSDVGRAHKSRTSFASHGSSSSGYSDSASQIADVYKSGKGKGKKKGEKGKKHADDKTDSGIETKEAKEKKDKKSTAEIETGETKDEKKGKKDKKGKKGKKSEGEIAPVEDDDVLGDIMKMMAAQEGPVEETPGAEEAPKEKKKKKKKQEKKEKERGPKLSKKEKAKLAAEMAEKAKLDAEAEAKRLAEEERLREIEERKAAIEKEKRETIEQANRVEQLDTAKKYNRKIVEYNLDLAAKAKVEMEWKLFVECGRLPDPARVALMNTYIHLWENDIEKTMMPEAASRTRDVVELLHDLDNIIDTARDDEIENVDNWTWVRNLVREHQAQSLDIATYRILRDVDHNMTRIDIPTAEFRYQDDNIAMCIWLRIQLPTPMPNPRKPPKPRIELHYPEMKMTVGFPASIDCDKMAIRAVYQHYDHLSDLCQTYAKPPVPHQLTIELSDLTKEEWREKLLYKYENRTIHQRVLEDGEEEPPPEPPKVFGPDDDIPAVPYKKLEPTASEIAVTKEEQMYNDIRASLITTVPDENVINLRRFFIVGGVYLLNLVYQPPQPQCFVTMDMTLTPLSLPKQLEFVDWYERHVPPVAPEPGAQRLPEEIEAELKQQEEELDKLILVTLMWPQHVIFIELPIVCHWDVARRVWTKEDVFDLKHNEEKGELSFRTGRFGTFALATNRYVNLPFQAWELRPESDDTVTLQITAAILMVEFNVKEDLIAMTQLQNSPNNALQDIVGVYHKLPKLIRLLQRGGVDLFPAFDAFCYVTAGTCEKHWPMVRQLYFDMAQMSTCFNFTWSRWNLTAGRRNVVLQMREFTQERQKQKNYDMLLVTPLKAVHIDCTEISQAFSDEMAPNMKFYPTLYSLMKGTTSVNIRTKVSSASRVLIYTLYELLLATRVLSLS